MIPLAFSSVRFGKNGVSDGLVKSPVPSECPIGSTVLEWGRSSKLCRNRGN
jgi:hypothetical protein